MRANLSNRVLQFVLTGAETGEFSPAAMLPSERELAGTLSVSRNAVTVAYTELERRGVLRRIHGKGAYLCALPSEGESFSWSGKISRFANALDEPVLEILARSCADTIRYPLSAGTPSLAVFPQQSYAASLNRVLKIVPSVLAVGAAEGRWQLREALGRWLGTPPQQVMVTAGAQEGIDLMARCLIEPGDYVVVDDPTYPGALQSFLSAGARLLAWKTDWSLRHLEDLLLRYRPKLIFTTPTFQNPTGRVMSLKTRGDLLELAHRYRVPIMEDDVYRHTYFTSHPMPESLYKLDTRSQVVNVSTFSKILAPGLRVGWLTGPLYMVKQLALIKMRSNLFTGGLNQAVLADMLQSGEFDRHLERLRAHHRDLCDIAVDILKPLVESGILSFRIPTGSLYLWCKLLLPHDPELVLAALEAAGVSVAPGHAFAADREAGPSPFFRVCFSAIHGKQLADAVQALHDVLFQLRCVDGIDAATAAPGVKQ